MKKNLFLLLGASLLALSSCVNSPAEDSSDALDADSSLSEELSHRETSDVLASSEDKHESSIDEPSSVEESSSSMEEQTDWSDEDLLLFNTYLHGVIPPFPMVGGVQAFYSQEDEAIIVTGGETDSEYIESYMGHFSKAWAVEDISDSLNLPEHSAFALERFTEVEGKHYRVSVSIGCMSNNALSNSGTFVMLANDPFLYDYPGEYVSSLINGLGSDILLPELKADCYAIEEDHRLLKAYFHDTHTSNAFVDSLRKAGFGVDEDTDAADAFADDYATAISPDGVYCLHYRFFGWQGQLNIYFTRLMRFPYLSISRFINAYGGVGFTVPGYEKTGFEYSLYEDPYNDFYVDNGRKDLVRASLYIFGATEADLALYQETLGQWGYGVTSIDNGAYWAYYAYGGKLHSINVSYQAQYGAMVITIYALEESLFAAFPGDKIEESLSEIEDRIPAYSNDAIQGYRYIDESNAWGVEIFGDDAEQMLQDYLTILGNAGFVPSEDNPEYMLSEHGDLTVNLYPSSTKSIIVAFALTPHPDFPGTEIARILGEELQDSVPELTGGYDYRLYRDETGDYLTILFTSYDEAENAENRYKTVLSNSGYQPEEGIYISEHREIEIEFYQHMNSVIIVFSLHVEEAPAWPNDFANVFNDPLPEYPGEYKSASYQYTGKNHIITVNLKDASSAAAVETYIGILTENDFYYSSTDVEFGDIYYRSPNGEYEVTVYALSDYSFAIQAHIYVTPLPGGDGFPHTAIASFLGSGADPVPFPGLDHVEYDFLDLGDMAMISVDGEGIDETSAISDYLVLLEQEGYTFAKADGFGDTWYISSNGTTLVSVGTYMAGSFYIYVKHA